MKIEVRGRSGAREFCPDEPWAAIQISTMKDEWPKLSGVKRLGCLQLHFADADHPAFKERAIRMGSQWFDQEMAGQVFDFVSEMREKGVETFLIHCEAGQCRSPAIAAALDKIETNDDMKWFRERTPNAHVYRTMLETAVERGTFGQIDEDRMPKPTGGGINMF